MPARLRVRLTPRAGRDEIGGFDDAGVLRVRVAAPPVDGGANDALIRLIAKRAGVPPSLVSIVAGTTARVKTIHVSGIDDAALRAMLGAAPTGEEGAS